MYINFYLIIMKKNIGFAEYIWLDGNFPTRLLRSKTKVVFLSGTPALEEFPEWNFDGSSTLQSESSESDCILKPVSLVKDTVTGRENGYLLLCEVYNKDGKVHESNSRAILRKVLDAGADNAEPYIGFEQEYTFFKDKTPLGWPSNGYPGPQGPILLRCRSRHCFWPSTCGNTC